MASQLIWHEHASRAAASQACANALGESLHQVVKRQGRATIALCGGQTPVACYQYLSQMPLPWDQITLLPTDERCVPVDHEARNQRMIDQHLRQGAAAASHWMNLEQWSFQDLPIDAVLLGMGEDGHIASLFADVGSLNELLSLTAPPSTAQVQTAASPYARVTLNLSALMCADSVTLLLFGTAKRRVLEASRQSDSSLPVSALWQHQQPISVFYAD